jgi:hypothetical protein
VSIERNPRDSNHQRGHLTRGFQALCQVLCVVSALCLSLPALAERSSSSWEHLSAGQQTVLAPLSGEWQEMDPQRQHKWLEFANRYPQMTPQQQDRAQERMRAWAGLSPQDRQAARKNFREAQKFTPEQRQRAWEQYNALASDEREKLQQEAGQVKPKPRKPPRPQLPPAPQP